MARMSLGEKRQSAILPCLAVLNLAPWRRHNAVVLGKEDWILLQEPQRKAQIKVCSSKTKKNIAEGLLESFRKKFFGSVLSQIYFGVFWRSEC